MAIIVVLFRSSLFLSPNGYNLMKQEQVVQAKTAGRMTDPFLTDLNQIHDEEDIEETLRFACQ